LFVSLEQHSRGIPPHTEPQQPIFWYAASPATHRAPDKTTATSAFVNM
jgi:hypothetical protein